MSFYFLLLLHPWHWYLLWQTGSEGRIGGYDFCVPAGLISSFSNSFGLFLSGKMILGVKLPDRKFFCHPHAVREKSRAMKIIGPDMPLSTPAFNIIPRFHNINGGVFFVEYRS